MAVPWPVGSGGRRYGVPEHKTANGGHGKDGELTVSLGKATDASRKGSKSGVDGGGNL